MLDEMLISYVLCASW